jgi:hypothetical protein
MKTTSSIIAAISISLLIINHLKADFISLIKADQCTNIVEMFINDGSIRITIEIGENDFKWFKNVVPEEYYPEGFSVSKKEERFKAFFTRDFLVIADGKTLIGEIKRVERTKRILRASLYTGKVDSSRANEYVIFVEAEYKLTGKPKRITFVPPTEDEYDVTFANIGFVTYHKKIPVNDIRYLGTAETLNLNWNDPWYSYYDNRNLRRHHKSSLMSYLYIQPYEQDNLKKIISGFLRTKNIVRIDGRTVEPIVDRVHFVEVRMSGIQVLEKVKDLDYSSAIVGVIFAYTDPGIPQEVTVSWDLFSTGIESVPATATDPAGPMKYILMPTDSVLVWKNFLKKYQLPTISEIKVTEASIGIPLITIILLVGLIILIYRNGIKINLWDKRLRAIVIVLIVLVIITIPATLNLELPFMKKESFSKPEAKTLISELLKNTYRAFDFREESDVYDKLAISNSGDLLADVYLQTKKGMVLENQGGISVKVDDVNVIDVEEVGSDKSGIAYNCKWQVKGTVGHWGHIHRRTNQYNAVLGVKPVNGVWKLNALDIIEEKRL